MGPDKVLPSITILNNSSLIGGMNTLRAAPKQGLQAVRVEAVCNFIFLTLPEPLPDRQNDLQKIYIDNCLIN